MADLNIPSFSQRALVYGLSTNFLYPSNSVSKTAPIENPSPSLTETISKLGIDILDYTAKNDWVHQCGKPVRVVARIIYAKVVYTLIAPLGVLYHFSGTTYYGGKWAIVWLRGQENLPETAQKVQGHAWALLSDSFYTALGAWSSVLPYMSYLGYQDGEIGAALILGFYSVLCSGEFLLYGLSPMDFFVIPIFEWSLDQKKAFLESLLFRNELGLVGKENGLLPIVKEDIETLDLKGVLGSLWIKESLEVLQIVKEFNIHLVETRHSDSQFLFRYSPPHIESILDRLENDPLLHGYVANYEHYETLVNRLKELKTRSLRYHSLLSEYFAASFTNGVIVPNFPLTWEYSRAFVYVPSNMHVPPHNPEPKPDKYLPYLCKEDLNVLYFGDANEISAQKAHKKYLTFKKGIQAHKPLTELLGLPTPVMLEALNAAYRDLSRILHPDRRNGRIDARAEVRAETRFQAAGRPLDEALKKKLLAEERLTAENQKEEIKALFQYLKEVHDHLKRPFENP